MRRTLGIIGGVVCAVLCSQFPEYAQQYTQRLGGAVDVLRGEVEKYDAQATNEGLSRDQYVEHFEESGDPIVVRDGENKRVLIARYEDLSATLKRISEATPLQRFNLLPQFFDTEIGGRTLDNFKPAVPVTAEGFLYALFGFALGYGIAKALASLLTLPWRWRRYHPVRH